MKVNGKKIEWSDFDEFKNSDDYLPVEGDGDTMGTQAATAVSKIIYKWFNDGDVYDNNYILKGWGNDISGSANWLYEYIPETRKILLRIKTCKNKDDYTNLLYDLINVVDPMIPELNKKERIGNAYFEDGPFEFNDDEEDDDEYNEYDEDEDEDEDW